MRKPKQQAPPKAVEKTKSKPTATDWLGAIAAVMAGLGTLLLGIAAILAAIK
jgi:hypothetical protein